MPKLRALDQQRRLWLCALLVVRSTLSPAHSELVPETMDVHWNEGSEDCSKNPQPPIQVHQYNAQTFILRERKA
jgi:hydroxyacylglutathione hydrolase